MSADVTCERLTTQFGETRAVDALSFTAPAGELTGFIGVNGAGKTTTIRTLLGLVAPTSGTALIGGRRYRDLQDPRHIVGAVLDVPGAHPGHAGRAHLEILALAARADRTRVTELLELVDLSEHAGRPVGTYSLGMRQRLALAAALLCDPPVLILDEPTKGLDPAGIRWLRELLRDLTDEGRCVLVSSHHLAELEAVADRVVMIERGRLVADEPIGELLRRRGGGVLVETPAADRLAGLILAAGGDATPDGGERIRVTGLSAARIGDLAADARVPIHRLDDAPAELEDVFFGLTTLSTQEVPDVAGDDQQ